MFEIVHTKHKQYGIPHRGTKQVMSIYWNIYLIMVTSNWNM
jgi:hypothetical protein